MLSRHFRAIITTSYLSAYNNSHINLMIYLKAHLLYLDHID